MKRTKELSLFRILDANLNRAREGLRVCEEVARLVLEDPKLTRRCQHLRYNLQGIALDLSRCLTHPRFLEARDTHGDVGRPSERGIARAHRDYRDVVSANSKRTEEALRVLEEFTRLKSPKVSGAFGALRFRAYSLEQDLLSKL
ncbi:MAG: hypothetical protein HYZ90_02850 [Candidatus Omnitrophica bacterium]|nr:hypothetical protein [Candidatus Omnitrophota bacterium]